MMKLLLPVLVLALFAAQDAESRGIFGYKTYRLLGDSPKDTCRRNGLSITSSGTTITAGPEGLKAFEFHGKPDSFVKISNNGAMNLGGKSWTVGTFFYQEGKISNGPMLEWRGQGPDGNHLSFGTHFWIWHGVVFTNLDVMSGKNTTQYTVKPPTANAWHFVGASYNVESGDFYMWNDKEIFHKGTGKLDTFDQTGDVYIGIRPAKPDFNPLKAKLAGMTLLEGAITKSQIDAFRTMILV